MKKKKKKLTETLGINCLLEGTSNRTQLISILSSLKFVLVKLMGEKTLSGLHNIIIYIIMKAQDLTSHSQVSTVAIMDLW